MLGYKNKDCLVELSFVVWGYDPKIIDCYNIVMYFQRLVLRSGDRQAGSTYGNPKYSGISFSSQMNDADFYKVYLLNGSVSAEIPAGGDESHLGLHLVAKQPINQVRGTGSGSAGTGLVGMLPFAKKEQSNANFYDKGNHGDNADNYVLLAKDDIQDGNIELNITDGKDTYTITEPSSGTFSAWTIVLGFAPISREELSN